MRMLRVIVFVLIITMIATAADKTPPTYQKGTITGYNTMAISDSSGGAAPLYVYELQGTDLIYQFAACSLFQQEKFAPGQAVDYRVDGKRIYVRHGNDKEHKCRVMGTRTLGNAKPAEGAKPDALPTAASPAAPPAKP